MDDVATLTPLGRTVWHSKYRLAAGHELPEEHIGDTWRRESRAIAAGGRAMPRIAVTWSVKPIEDGSDCVFYVCQLQRGRCRLRSGFSFH